MTDRSSRLRAAIQQFSSLRVLVVGDVMLDEYLIGSPARVSREAPVLVLEQRRRFVRPGGGANPAVNVSAMGASARLVGVVGDDSVGTELRGALRELNISDADLVVDAGSETTRKTRVLAETSGSQGQQMVRIDRIGPAPGPVAAEGLVERIESLSERADAILLSDYQGGTVSSRTIEAARTSARKHGRLLTVDSQGGLNRFRGFDLVKCNRPDAESFLGRSIRTDSEYAEAGLSLVRQLEIGCLMITLGPDGTSVTTESGSEHVPVSNRTEVFDVTGAGDTAVAIATLVLAAGLDAGDAAYLANLAAGQVVRRLGVVTTSPDELRELLGEV